MSTIKVFYDKEKSLAMMERIRKKFGAESRRTPRGKEMHVSDLTLCPLKPFCRLIGLKQVHSKSAIGIMVYGIVAENMIGWTYPAEQLQYQSFIPSIEKDENIFGHIDIYEDNQFPLEVKSSRKTVFKASDLPKYWVEQLMSYMAMQGANLGWIVLFNIFSATIMAFQMQMSKRDIIGWLITLSERATRIRNTYEESKSTDPFKASLHLEPNGEEYEYCSYKKECPRKLVCRDKWKEFKRKKDEARKAKKRKKNVTASLVLNK